VIVRPPIQGHRRSIHKPSPRKQSILNRPDVTRYNSSRTDRQKSTIPQAEPALGKPFALSSLLNTGAPLAAPPE